MKVYYSTSASYIEHNINESRQIVKTLKSLGHKITREWIEEAIDVKASGKKYSSAESKKIYSDNIKALKEADVVILETTFHTFNTGYLASLSITLEKPLLILTRNSNHKATFLLGEPTTLKHIEVYSSLDDLTSIINEFMRDNESSAKDIRFNMLIGRSLSNFLKRESKTIGKSKAQIVREILEDYLRKREGL